jgi:Asp-tRNA(Asn)/Glu-tRNA(Gln) amidotransferase A subunit family amidase
VSSPYGADVPVDRLIAELPEWAWTSLSRPIGQQAVIPDPDGSPPQLADSPFVWHTASVAPPSGPLAGLRLAVKDLIAVAGHPLRAGSSSRQSVPPEPAHAPIVARLLDHGAVLVGATRLHELAFGVTGVNRFEGTVPNPAAPDRVPGGSSSGSAAAVALRLADVALATDTGGSARIPAALCGVVGYKASRRLPTAGVLPLSPSLDHLGWCARSVDVVRRTAHAAGLVSEPTFSNIAHRPRIGFVPASIEACVPEVRGPLEASLAALRWAGFPLVELDWPHAELVVAVSTTVMFSEAASRHLPPVTGDTDRYGSDVRARFERGRSISATAYLAALALQDRISTDFSVLLTQADVIAGPTTSIPAPLLTEADEPWVSAALVRNTRLDDLTGHPAISLPLQTGGLPVGLHLSGSTDDVLLDVAAAVEQALGATRPR